MRPIAIWPRAKRKARRVEETHLLACPRLCPDWEMSALQALCKPRPERRDAIIHRKGAQGWKVGSRKSVIEVMQLLSGAIGALPDVHFPKDGDFIFVCQFRHEQFEQAKTLAIALTRRVPEIWLTLGRLFVHDGKFYRRRRGYMLQLSPATDVHLPRAMRAALRGIA